MRTLFFFLFFFSRFSIHRKCLSNKKCHTAGSATLLHLFIAAVVQISTAAGGRLPLSMLSRNSEFSVAWLDVFVS